MLKTMLSATHNVPATPIQPADPVRASVSHLVTKAYKLPCTAAAQAFVKLVQPTARFQLALDALLPILYGEAESPQRILISYILYSLYASYPITMNPFRSAFLEVFVRERALARKDMDGGVQSQREQFVWVLWKVLKGDGNDLGPYTPFALATSPIPQRLRAANLALEDESNFDISKQYPIPSNGRNGPRNGTPSPLSQKNGGAARKDDETKSEQVLQALGLLDAARNRVLTMSEQRIVVSVLKNLNSRPPITASDLPSLISFNPGLAYPLLVTILKTPATPNPQNNARSFLNVLKQLPPTLPSMDILGRLLHDKTQVRCLGDSNDTPVVDLIRSEVLGAFIANGIRFVEQAEKDQQDGLISDDRVPQSVQNLCRFYSSLLKLGILDPTSDTDSAEMATFALTHSQYDEASSLYRVLVGGKF